MSATPQEIRGFFDEAERLAAQSRVIREAFAAMRGRALKKQIDWTQLKALAVAHDADKHDDKNCRHVAKLVAKAEYANWYADILHLGVDEQVRITCSSTETATPNDAGADGSPRHVAEPALSTRPPPLPGAGSSFPEPDPRDDIRNQPFYRGAVS